jgi:hypothetical protein
MAAVQVSERSTLSRVCWVQGNSGLSNDKEETMSKQFIMALSAVTVMTASTLAYAGGLGVGGAVGGTVGGAGSIGAGPIGGGVGAAGTGRIDNTTNLDTRRRHVTTEATGAARSTANGAVSTTDRAAGANGSGSASVGTSGAGASVGAGANAPGANANAGVNGSVR